MFSQIDFSFKNSVGKIWDKLEGWLDALVLKLPNIALAIITMVIFYFLAKVIRNLTQKYLLGKISQVSIQHLVAKTVFLVVMMIGFFIALDFLELDKVLTSILAGAGVVGLAIGLALQGTLSNTFGGVVLSFLPRIRIGDYIETTEAEGFVDEISLRNIVLRRPDNNYVIMPNAKFIDNAFTNYSLTKRTRIAVECGVGYESKLQEVEDIVVALIEENFEQREGEEIQFYFTEFGDSSINFMVRFWINMTKNAEKYHAQHQAIKLIKTAFDDKGINIPFPIRTLDFAKNNLKIENPGKEE